VEDKMMDAEERIDRIVTIFGTRPQFIKCASLSRELRKHHDEVLINTGQHYDYNLSGIFKDDLGMPEPDYDLGVGSKNQGKQTAEILSAVEDVLIEERPDLVIVFGDTNSTLAGALAASKLHISIAHVEAGVRSFDREMPEEINRILTDHLSDLLFAPTLQAEENLRKEGILKGVSVVGDVMVDSVLANLEEARKRSNILERLGIENRGYLVATIHRQCNTDRVENLSNIIRALGMSRRTVILPMHPRTRSCMSRSGMLARLPPNVVVTEPLGYLDMLMLMSEADKVVTDSGGVQLEAYTMRVPCVTVRETTEWPETIEDGWNVLVGTDMERILNEILTFAPYGPRGNPYGDGDACEKIVNILDQREASDEVAEVEREAGSGALMRFARRG
jgi:UDP-N-acetylglucosamine 2-epimerase (non-hydrolysing)